jgi:hypothetical protein
MDIVSNGLHHDLIKNKEIPAQLHLADKTGSNKKQVPPEIFCFLHVFSDSS